MTLFRLALLLAFTGPGVGAALAEGTSVSTTPPSALKNSAKPTATKHKPVADLKKLDTPPAEKPASGTVPMDFSGMARRPVDLPSQGETSQTPKQGPGLNANDKGGVSPGMNFNF